MLDRAFLTVEPRAGAEPSLTLIPQSRNGPPEVCYFDYETDHPGLLHYTYGRGRTAYFPWPVDQLFFDHSLPEHRALLAQAVAAVAGAQHFVTNAPPQVEVVLSLRRTGEYVLHLINHSGHQDRSFHDSLPIFDIDLSLALDGVCPTSARALVANEMLPITVDGGRTCLRISRLDGFEVVVLS